MDHLLSEPVWSAREVNSESMKVMRESVKGEGVRWRCVRVQVGDAEDMMDMLGSVERIVRIMDVLEVIAAR